MPELIPDDIDWLFWLALAIYLFVTGVISGLINHGLESYVSRKENDQ
jgi:hypothetical protein